MVRFGEFKEEDTLRNMISVQSAGLIHDRLIQKKDRRYWQDAAYIERLIAHE